jgi:hypothetical protein
MFAPNLGTLIVSRYISGRNKTSVDAKNKEVICRDFYDRYDESFHLVDRLLTNCLFQSIKTKPICRNEKGKKNYMSFVKLVKYPY